MLSAAPTLFVHFEDMNHYYSMCTYPRGVYPQKKLSVKKLEGWREPKTPHTHAERERERERERESEGGGGGGGREREIGERRQERAHCTGEMACSLDPRPSRLATHLRMLC
jgi:hypothetical protein